MKFKRYIFALRLKQSRFRKKITFKNFKPRTRGYTASKKLMKTKENGWNSFHWLMKIG